MSDKTDSDATSSDNSSLSDESLSSEYDELHRDTSDCSSPTRLGKEISDLVAVMKKALAARHAYIFEDIIKKYEKEEESDIVDLETMQLVKDVGTIRERKIRKFGLQKTIPQRSKMEKEALKRLKRNVVKWRLHVKKSLYGASLLSLKEEEQLSTTSSSNFTAHADNTESDEESLGISPFYESINSKDETFTVSSYNDDSSQISSAVSMSDKEDFLSRNETYTVSSDDSSLHSHMSSISLEERDLEETVFLYAKDTKNSTCSFDQEHWGKAGTNISLAVAEGCLFEPTLARRSTELQDRTFTHEADEIFVISKINSADRSSSSETTVAPILNKTITFPLSEKDAESEAPQPDVTFVLDKAINSPSPSVDMEANFDDPTVPLPKDLTYSVSSDSSLCLSVLREIDEDADTEAIKDESVSDDEIFFSDSTVPRTSPLNRTSLCSFETEVSDDQDKTYMLFSDDSHSGGKTPCAVVSNGLSTVCSVQTKPETKASSRCSHSSEMTVKARDGISHVTLRTERLRLSVSGVSLDKQLRRKKSAGFVTLSAKNDKHSSPLNSLSSEVSTNRGRTDGARENVRNDLSESQLHLSPIRWTCRKRLFTDEKTQPDDTEKEESSTHYVAKLHLDRSSFCSFRVFDT